MAELNAARETLKTIAIGNACQAGDNLRGMLRIRAALLGTDPAKEDSHAPTGNSLMDAMIETATKQRRMAQLLMELECEFGCQEGVPAPAGRGGSQFRGPERGEADTAVAVVVIVLVILVIVGLFFAFPAWNVWRARQSGEADFAHAEQSRRIAVLEATAKKDAAIMLAEAEVERAKGVAKANQIIGESLKGNEDYLRYLWVQALENHQNSQVIYVPTEANLPILEASRLHQKEK